MRRPKSRRVALRSAAPTVVSRGMPAAAAAAAAALSLGAYAGHASRVAAKHAKPTFSVTVSPASDTIAAGTTAGYRLRIRRKNFPALIALSVGRPYPPAVGVHFTPRRTRRSRSTLTIRTKPWTPVGTYHLVLRANSGKRSKTIPLTLNVAGPASGTGSAGVSLPPFGLSGSPARPLEPGIPQGIDLQISNPNGWPLVVTSLTTAVKSVSAPKASPSLPCTAVDFAVRQYFGPLPLKVPAYSTRSLSDLGVPASQWPEVSIIDLPTNQDGCQGAVLTLAYAGVATLG